MIQLAETTQSCKGLPPTPAMQQKQVSSSEDTKFKGCGRHRHTMHKERSQASKKANNKMSTMCAIMCREVSGVNANRFTSRRQSPVKKGIEEHKTGDKSVVENTSKIFN